MQRYKYFIGIDVSKNHLDLVLRNQEETLSHKKIDNQVAEIRKCLAAWEQSFGVQNEDTLVCLEHTGRYMNIVLGVLHTKSYDTWIESPLAMKRSIGLQRGKNDKVDAIRIADFAMRHQDKAFLYEPDSKSLQELRALENCRKKLVKYQKGIQSDLQDSKRFEGKEIHSLKNDFFEDVLGSLKEKIKELDKKMAQIIKSDARLAHLNKLITSVVGIGPVTAVALLVATKAFTRFDCGKKLACYCGVVPFENSSGSSIRGKSRTSKFSNRHLNSLLHLCASTVIQREGELKDYYDRKLSEGKSKMSVLNAIKNKIILRVMACVRNDREYQKKYPIELA